MKWLKYLLQAIVMLSDLFLIGCVLIVFLCVPFPFNFILGIGSIFWIKWVHKGKDGMKLFASWKKGYRNKFFKSWDAMCDGKVHTEIRDGERCMIIDVEED